MMPGAGSARGDEANRAAVPPRSFARISGVQAAARPPRVALMGGCISVHRTFALFRGSARAGAVIPNERIIPGLRPIPRGALPSGTPHPAVLRAPPPPPPGGRGSHGDIRWKAVSDSRSNAGFPEGWGEPARIRFFPGISPCTVAAPGVGRGFQGGTHRYPPAGRGKPLPGPLPPWRYPHGPLHGEIPEENRIRLIPGYPHALPPPLSGRGRSAKRGRGGGTERALWVRWEEGQIWSVHLESLH